jgi:hypothetical protein
MAIACGVVVGALTFLWNSWPFGTDRQDSSDRPANSPSIESPTASPDPSNPTSFEHIPGVTDIEIAAVEALRTEFDFFNFGAMLSIDLYINEHNVIEDRGFSEFFCEWLSELFSIQFVPTFYWSSSNLLDGFENRAIDFTDWFYTDENRHRSNYITDNIVIKFTKQMTGRRLSSSVHSFAARVALVEGSASLNEFQYSIPYYSDAIVYESYDNAYNAFLRGEVDIFVTEGTGGFEFEVHMYRVISLAASSPELAVITSIVQKAFDNGAADYLSLLYNNQPSLANANPPPPPDTPLPDNGGVTEYYPGDWLRTFTDVTGYQLRGTRVTGFGADRVETDVLEYEYDFSADALASYKEYLLSIGFTLREERTSHGMTTYEYVRDIILVDIGHGEDLLWLIVRFS